MSNRIFDSSELTRRLRDLNIAQQMYGSMNNNRDPNNPQSGNTSDDIINKYLYGSQTIFEKSLRGSTLIQLGGVANYVTPPIETGGGGGGATVPGAPTINSVTPGNTTATVNFTAGSTGGSIITDYKYSINGSTYVSAGTIASPFTITGLTNGQTYPITIKAVNAVGDGAVSNSVNVTLTLINMGIAQWATDLSGTGNDTGYSITVDSQNNIYVTGQYTSTSAVYVRDANGNTQSNSSIYLPMTVSTDVFIIKYNSSGIAQWATNLPGTGNDAGYSITVDSQDNIYVTGQYLSTSIVYVRDASGNTQSNSSIYLPMSVSTFTDVFIIKYNSSGIAQWATNLSGTGADTGRFLTVDSQDNIYVTGQYTSTSAVNVRDTSGNTQRDSSIYLPTTLGIDVFIIKYNSSGIAQWATNLSGTGADTGRFLTVDSQDNIYVTGQYISTSAVNVRDASGNTQKDSSISLPITVSIDVFIIKYNSSGIAQWATNLPGTGNDVGYSITVDSQDNIYVTGQYLSTSIVYVRDASGNTQSNSSIYLPMSVSTFTDVFIIKYNSSGIAQWATNLPGTSNDAGYYITVDSQDNIYVTGQYISTSAVNVRDASGNTQKDSSISLPMTVSTFTDVFIIKYNSSGIAQWATNLPGTGNDAGYSITVDSQDNIYVTGQYTSTSVVYVRDASGNTQSNSSIYLPITQSTFTNVFIIKYS